MWWWVIYHLINVFCGFWSVAVITSDKLQFFNIYTVWRSLMSRRWVGPNCCFASVRLRRARMDGFGTRCRQTSARPAQIRIMPSDGRPTSPLVLSIPSERVGARRDLHSTPSDCFRTVLIDALRRASDTRGLRTSCGHVRRRLATRTRPACRYQPRRRPECRSQRGVKYIWWQCRNFVPYIYQWFSPPSCR